MSQDLEDNGREHLAVPLKNSKILLLIQKLTEFCECWVEVGRILLVGSFLNHRLTLVNLNLNSQPLNLIFAALRDTVKLFRRNKCIASVVWAPKK